ncbi:GNAT family N-acetyltransferase [Mucilaginibacter calamicampi]|uniref:GNAT family N-acetyltransferase n=1 Tax=Mucilaginibacter calamicampi TaxID=1302352 RepID=A0ABW2YSR6_9SPHI
MNKVYMNDEVFINNGFSISTDNSLLDIDLIYNYLDKDSYWANGIPFEKLERSINNSLCFGLYYKQKQIGFARVVTDKAVFGYLADVFILPEHRKKGLSKWLVQTIMAHPDLQGLRRWSLATLDAHGLYAQFGFTELTNSERWMQIFTPHKIAES